MATKLSETGVVFPDLTTQTTAATTGVTSAVAGTGVSVSAATGAVTFTNSGVTSLVAGTGISVSGATGAVTVSATGGGVTSAVAGNGITVSGATGAVTFSQDIYTGSTSNNTSFPIGSYIIIGWGGTATQVLNNSSFTPYVYNNSSYANEYYNSNPSGSGRVALSGTWRTRGAVQNSGCTQGGGFLGQRTA